VLEIEIKRGNWQRQVKSGGRGNSCPAVKAVEMLGRRSQQPRRGQELGIWASSRIS